MRNNSTNHSGGIIDSTWGWVPGLHTHSEAKAILEQRLLFVSLCEARMAFKRLWGIIVRIIPEASLTAPEDKCLVCTLTRKLLQRLLFVPLCWGKDRLSMLTRKLLEQRLLFVPLCWGKDRLRMLTRKQRPYLATIALCFHCVRQGFHKTMRNNSTNHSGGIIDSTWGWVPGTHSEAEAILEQRLLFVPLCWGKDRLCMLTRKQRPYLSNDCSLFHCVEARTDFACSLGSRGHTWATIALCSIVLRQGQTSHAHSEAEAILEQRLLFVSLCEARKAFTRLWGIIVRIIPEASLTAPEDECLACMLTFKRRPYLSNDCSLFHCVRQGRPSQDYEE